MLNGEELLATWLRPTVVKVTKTNTLSTTDAQRAEDNATGGGASIVITVRDSFCK